MEKSLLALKQTISHEIANENCQDPDLGSVIGKFMSAWLLCGHVSSQGFNFYPSLCSKLSWGLTFTFRDVMWSTENIPCWGPVSIVWHETIMYHYGWIWPYWILWFMVYEKFHYKTQNFFQTLIFFIVIVSDQPLLK